MNGIIVGILCIAIFIFLYYKKKKWINTCIQTTGVITKIISKKVHRANGHISYTNIPLVKFTYLGREFAFENEVGGTQYNQENIEVNVLFKPENPSDARIVSFLSLWLLETILAGIGLPFYHHGNSS